MHKKAKWLISTLLTLIAPAALKSQSPQGQNPHGISIESLCSKPNQQQIEMLTRFAEERGVVFSRNNCASLVKNILKKGFFDPYKQKFLGLQSDVQAPPLMLAKTWKKGNNIRGWWMSEKFDGVRAFWTGRKLITRQGHQIHAPSWFTESLPGQALDGELWISRKQFAKTLSVVLDQNPGTGWSEVHYLVFDAPDLSGVFEQRMKQTRKLLKTMNLDYIRWVEQKRCNSEKELLNFLNRIEAKGAEGLMLRKPGSQYKAGRSANLLKVKSFQENVGTVIQHLPGKGRNQGRMGSLLIEMDNGIRFRLGGGFKDAERENPPAPGTRIVFKHYGYTKTNKPRMASYLRLDLEI